MNHLDFEAPINELEAKIEELKSLTHAGNLNIAEEIAKLKSKSIEMTMQIFKDLTPWQISLLARHPLRPYTLDYIPHLFTDFEELQGDRVYGEDKAIVAGLARFEGQPVMVIGQQKGRTTAEKILRNFGMPHPEGYRKAHRLLDMAESFKLPVITIIDTPGAYAGVEAEARGQSEAIARNLRRMSELKVPIVSVVIGEGASGGALGIGVADRILMCQYAYYATISPEGCAAILFKNSAKAPEAAEMMGITATNLLKLKLIDSIIPEPLGGAHRNLEEMAQNIKKQISETLNGLKTLPIDVLVEQRYQRLMAIGS